MYFHAASLFCELNLLSYYACLITRRGEQMIACACGRVVEVRANSKGYELIVYKNN